MRPSLSVSHLQQLNDPGDFSGTDAPSAHALASHGSAFVDFDWLDIGIPLSSRMPVGVGNVVARCGALSTNITFSGQLLHLLP